MLILHLLQTYFWSTKELYFTISIRLEGEINRLSSSQAKTTPRGQIDMENWDKWLGDYLWYKALTERKNCLDKNVVKNYQFSPVVHQMATWLHPTSQPKNFLFLFQFWLHHITTTSPKNQAFLWEKNCGDYAVYHRVTISFFNFETFFSAHVFQFGFSFELN